MLITANTASQISWRKKHSLKERLALFKQSLQVLLQVPVSKVAACIIAEKPFDWIQRLLDALFVHNVQPAIGSIVYCNLLIAVEHTGIYVGNNKIVHLDGEGIVKLVSTKEFCQRLGGFNPANTVFCPTGQAYRQPPSRSNRLGAGQQALPLQSRGKQLPFIRSPLLHRQKAKHQQLYGTGNSASQELSCRLLACNSPEQKCCVSTKLHTVSALFPAVAVWYNNYSSKH